MANCLPPLVPSIKDQVPDLVKRLLQLLLRADNYGERRGASYGLAGLIKGSGILVMKQLDIMASLTKAMQNKKSPKEREGNCFSFIVYISLTLFLLSTVFEHITESLSSLLPCLNNG